MNTAELTIKVSIADDHKIFRDGIKMALKEQGLSQDYLGGRRWQGPDAQDAAQVPRRPAHGYPDAGSGRDQCHRYPAKGI